MTRMVTQAGWVPGVAPGAAHRHGGIACTNGTAYQAIRVRRPRVVTAPQSRHAGGPGLSSLRFVRTIGLQKGFSFSEAVNYGSQSGRERDGLGSEDLCYPF